MDKMEVLADFLNDTPTKLKSGVFEWRGLCYQVEYYPTLLKDKRFKASHFIKHEYKGRIYGIRELSEKVLKPLLDK